MPEGLDYLCSARLPAVLLPALAVLRCRTNIQAIVEGDQVWLRWPAGDDDVLRLVLPIPGVELYGQLDGEWVRHGQRLPVAAPPVGPAQRLDQLIVPERVAVDPAPTPSYQRVTLTLVRDGQPRPTAALLASLEDLHGWATHATSRQLAALKAARCGQQVLVLGAKLPALSEGVRLWGRRVLAPLGYRAEPDLPESALAGAIGLREGEIALFSRDPQGSEGSISRGILPPLPCGSRLNDVRIEIVPEDAFYALTRTAVRLAFAENRP